VFAGGDGKELAGDADELVDEQVELGTQAGGYQTAEEHADGPQAHHAPAHVQAGDGAGGYSGEDPLPPFEGNGHLFTSEEMPGTGSRRSILALLGAGAGS